jgi:hypothetical protein
MLILGRNSKTKTAKKTMKKEKKNEEPHSVWNVLPIS